VMGVPGPWRPFIPVFSRSPARLCVRRPFTQHPVISLRNLLRRGRAKRMPPAEPRIGERSVPRTIRTQVGCECASFPRRARSDDAGDSFGRACVQSP